MKEEQNATMLLTYQKDLKNESQLHKILSKTHLMTILVLYYNLYLIVGQLKYQFPKIKFSSRSFYDSEKTYMNYEKLNQVFESKSTNFLN